MKKTPLWAGLLLAGWCLLFLRCDTTEKSMVRAVYLAQQGQLWTMGLVYQAPEAAADASEASGALRAVGGTGPTLELARAGAEKALPQAADYRLCDYVLFPADTPAQTLTAYESLVLRRRCGRTAARAFGAEFTWSEFLAAWEENQQLPDKLLEKLKGSFKAAPHLYALQSPALLPLLALEDGQCQVRPAGVFRTAANSWALSAEQAEAVRLLTGAGDSWTFWLEGEPFTLRRCTVSVAVQGQTVHLRLDCQRGYGSPQPGPAQRQQLAELCAQTVEQLWKQGVDLLCLQQREALQEGPTGARAPTKNACPQLQADVRFLGM